MIRNNQTSTLINTKAILDTQMIGIARVLIGIPMEHIFDRAKTLLQVDKNASTQTFRNMGLKGILSGFSQNLTLSLFKQAYRFPMMIIVPTKIHEILPRVLVAKFPVIHKTIGGLSIGVLESIITCPLERLKCLKMTGGGVQQIVNMISPLQKIQFLFQGFFPLVLKQSVSWISYLYWDHRVRHAMKQNFSDSLSFVQIIVCAFLTGILNIATIQPFDTLKTLYQRHNSPYKGTSCAATLSTIVRQNGMWALYAGWQFKLLHFITQSMLTTPVIDYLERKYVKPTY